MRLGRLIVTLASVVLFASGGSASAAIVYSIESGVVSQSVNPLADAQTAAGYYDYPFEAASGNPDFGPEDDTAFFWLYTDTGTGVLSLGMIFDKRNPAGTGDGGNMNLTTSGMPAGTFVSVEDDPPEVGVDLVNGTEGWGWNAFNTDGGMVSGLEGTTWIIDIVFNSFAGLENGFFFLTGPDPLNPTKIALDIEAGSTLRIIASEVPEPGTLLLLSLGLLALCTRSRAR